MRHALILLLPLALAACGESDEDRNQRQDEQCRSWGAKPGSGEYIQCRATLAKEEEREDRQNASNAAAIAVGSMAIGMAAGRR